MFLDYLRELRRPGSTVSKPEHQPAPDGSFVGPLESIPASRREVYEVFGDPGVKKLDRAWARRNTTVAKHLPGTWNKGRGRLSIHVLVEPYLREALERCERAGVLGEIRRLGCESFRRQRHDPKRPLSYHSWSIAIDINPGDNKARRFSRDLSPEPFGQAWANWWPRGVSAELVECFESVGWKWGGRWQRFVDPMHFQLVR